MHMRLIVVGGRQPAWVETAFAAYTARLPRHWRFRLQPVPAARRARGEAPAGGIAAEGEKILALIKPADFVVVLDQGGRQPDSEALASQLQEWLTAGRDLCFVIGGADGVSNACLQRADYRWSLSQLTLPHGLARVLFAEQLYRAWSIGAGHPYHRD